MTKEQLLKNIEESVLRVIDTVKEEDLVKEKAGITVYRVNALEASGDSALAKNFFFYVVDEGTDNERAFYMDKKKPIATNQLRGEVAAALNAMPFEKVKVTETDPETEMIKATAYVKTDDDKLQEKQIILYKGESGPEYKELA